MTTELARPSIWCRLAAVLEDIDRATDPGSQQRKTIASLEKRIAGLEGPSAPPGRPE